VDLVLLTRQPKNIPGFAPNVRAVEHFPKIN